MSEGVEGPSSQLCSAELISKPGKVQPEIRNSRYENVVGEYSARVVYNALFRSAITIYVATQFVFGNIQAEREVAPRRGLRLTLG